MRTQKSGRFILRERTGRETRDMAERVFASPHRNLFTPQPAQCAEDNHCYNLLLEVYFRIYTRDVVIVLQKGWPIE
jgi:hypothetical protein